MKQSDYRRTDFSRNFILSTFIKPVEKIRVWLKSDKNFALLSEDLSTFIPPLVTQVTVVAVDNNRFKSALFSQANRLKF